jgi:RHS repeat-associated protein
LQDELGLNVYDYGARQYMPDLGRWWGIDVKAEKFSNISPYVYVANMPTIAVDPDGKDIFIPFKGNPNSADNRRQKAQVTSSLQKLTNSKIQLVETRGGYLVKTMDGKANEGKNLTVGTKLVGDLISSDKRVTVEAIEGHENITYTSKNGNSRVVFDPSNPADGSKGNSVKNADGTYGRPTEIALGHELVHAENNANGTVDNTLVKVVNQDIPNLVAFPNATPQGAVGNTTQNEINVREKENKIRAEQGVVPRAELKKAD